MSISGSESDRPAALSPEAVASLLGELAAQAVREEELRPLLHAMLDRTRAALGCGTAAVLRLEPETGRFAVAAATSAARAAGASPEGRRFAAPGTLAERGLNEGSLFLEPLEPFHAADPAVRAIAEHAPPRSLCLVPFADGADHRGVLAVADLPAAAGRGGLAVLEAVAAHIALAFDRARRARRQQRERAQMRAFAAVTKVTAAASVEDTLIDHAMEAILRAFPAERAELVTRDDGEVRVRYMRPAAVPRGHDAGSLDPLHARVRDAAEPVARGLAEAAEPPAERGAAARFAVCAPLVLRGRVVGSLLLARRDAAYDAAEVALIAAIARHVAAAIAHARSVTAPPGSPTSPEAWEAAARNAGPSRGRSRSLRALGQLAAGVAHDLNNALHPIVAYAEMIRDSTPDPERIRTYAERILLAARDGAETVRRVQRFTRRADPSIEDPVELARVVAEAVELSRPRMAERRARGLVEVVQAVPRGLRVRASAPELRRALLNLIANALDAMPDGGTIRIVAGVEPERLLLGVQDTGTGMPPDVLARAAEPFFTTKGSAGTGLGLSEVYGIAERLGGALELWSWPGIGTTVLLRLPPADVATGRPPAPRVEPSAARRRILLADDNALALEALAAALRGAGHDVVLAGTVDEALRRFEPDAYRAVITDLGMPDRSGWELLDRVRSLDPAVRLGVVTGWPVDEIGPDLRRRKVSLVFPKPVDPDDLLAAL